MIKKFAERCLNRETYLKEGKDNTPRITKEVKTRKEFLLDEELSESYKRSTPVEPFIRELVKMGSRPDIVKKYEDFKNDK